MNYTKKVTIDYYGEKKEVTVPNFPKIIAHVVGLIVVLTFVFGSFGTVATGEIGVKTTLGKVSGTVNPGLYFKLPLIQAVDKMDVQTQKEQTSASAASKDLQTVNAQVAINYNLDQNKVADLYSRIGTGYKGRVIDPAIQEVVKAATANYTAEELITKRPEVTDKIQTSLSERLAASDIIVSSVSITNFDFSGSFNAAIEAKVTAEQNALAAKNKLDQVKYEAEQKVTTAAADAKAIQIQAQAINSQGGADYVELQRIKAWDGHACTSYCGVSASTGLLINTK